jgi:hypothetical protein
MKKNILSFFILTCSFFVGEVVAQTPVPSPPESAPIDGFTSVLLAAGIGYGIHRMRKKTSINTHLEK